MTGVVPNHTLQLILDGQNDLRRQLDAIRLDITSHRNNGRDEHDELRSTMDAGFTAARASQEAGIGHIEGRVSALERGMSRIWGAVGALMAVGTGLWAITTLFVDHISTWFGKR